MPSKKVETLQGKIARLVRCAFDAAEKGDEKLARSLLKGAVNKGYAPDERTLKGFEICVEKGHRHAAARTQNGVDQGDGARP